jgi:hypothetical protein
MNSPLVDVRIVMRREGVLRSEPGPAPLRDGVVDAPTSRSPVVDYRHKRFPHVRRQSAALLLWKMSIRSRTTLSRPIRPGQYRDTQAKRRR